MIVTSIPPSVAGETAFEVSTENGPLLQGYWFRISLVGNLVHLWVKLLREPTRAEIRNLHRLFAEQALTGLLINVEESKPRNVRFAEFFGFIEVARQNGIIIMERMPCKQ